MKPTALMSLLGTVFSLGLGIVAGVEGNPLALAASVMSAAWAFACYRAERTASGAGNASREQPDLGIGRRSGDRLGSNRDLRPAA